MSPFRIAFTSCMDTVNYPNQPTWEELGRQKAHAVTLLGDSIYMDYGTKLGPFFISGGPRKKDQANGTPRALSDQAFSDRMHQRYSAQFAVEGFRKALNGSKVYAIWDDHDFAWNNSRGAGEDDGEALVPELKRRIATAHFRNWQFALRNLPLAYPANNVDVIQPPVGNGGIGESIELWPGKLWLHMLDGRSFREAGGSDAASAGRSLLGSKQRSTVEDLFSQNAAAIHVVAVGEPLKKWKKLKDAQWLLGWAQRRHIISICGDVHELGYLCYDANGEDRARPDDSTVLHEFSASAMAQWSPKLAFSKDTNAFGTLTIDGDSVVVALFKAATERRRLSLQRGPGSKWTSTTSLG